MGDMVGLQTSKFLHGKTLGHMKVQNWSKGIYIYIYIYVCLLFTTPS